jgi:hypothetical protein
MASRRLRLIKANALRAKADAELIEENVTASLEKATRRYEALRAAAAEAQTAAGEIKTLADQVEGETDVDRAEGLASTVDERLATATAAAARTAPSPTGAEPKSEWEECRRTIDRFDKLLVDLRKTGVGVITAIVGGAAFLLATPGQTSGTAATLANAPLVKLAIFGMIGFFIVTVYWIDHVHQIWLGVAVRRAKSLEATLGYRLTTDINERFSTVKAVLIGAGMYAVLLLVTFVIFWMSLVSGQPDILTWNAHQAAAGVLALLGIVVIAIGAGSDLARS